MRYQLLSVDQDTKTRKGRKYGYLTGILYLAPSTESGMGVDLCPFASQWCREACLYGAGMSGVFPSIKRSRIRKTRWYLDDRKSFDAALIRDIERLQLDAERQGLTPCVRLNGTSDQPKLARAMAKRFPNVQFYDYTKIPRPWQRAMDNYHLTFSYSGENLTECLRALEHGVNVAVVFGTEKGRELPKEWHGFRVVDGDLSDLRFRDDKGVVVGLRAKGEARGKANPFVILAA